MLFEKTNFSIWLSGFRSLLLVLTPHYRDKRPSKLFRIMPDEFAILSDERGGLNPEMLGSYKFSLINNQLCAFSFFIFLEKFLFWNAGINHYMRECFLGPEIPFNNFDKVVNRKSVGLAAIGHYIYNKNFLGSRFGYGARNTPH